MIFLLGVVANFNYLNIPIPGGETKPIYIFLAIPILLALTLRTSLKESDFWAFFATTFLIFHAIIYSILGCSECALSRLFSIIPGIILLQFLRRLLNNNIRLYGLFIRGFVYTGIIITVYSVIVQGFLSGLFSEFRHLDYLLRSLLLVRSRDHGKLTMFDAEPSFAALHLIVIFALLLCIKDDILPVRRRLVASITICAIIFTQSITAVMLLIPFAGSYIASQRLSKYLFFRITLVAIVASILLIHLSSRIFGIDVDLSTGARLLLAYSTILAWADAPVFGIGLGQYSLYWQNYIDLTLVNAIPQALQESIDDGSAMIKPFSVIGGYLAELGVFGFMFILMTYRPRFNFGVKHGLSVWLVVVAMLITAYPVSLPYVFILISLADYLKIIPCLSGCHPSLLPAVCRENQS